MNEISLGVQITFFIFLPWSLCMWCSARLSLPADDVTKEKKQQHIFSSQVRSH
jgi:hypothetical protein